MAAQFSCPLVMEAIQSKIAPFVGETLARASTRAHCESLGIAGAEMSGEELRRLLDRIAKGMRVFVGPGQTKQLLGEISAGLGVESPS